MPGWGRGFLSLSALASLRGAMPIAASPNSRSGRSSDSTSPIIAPSAVSASLNRPALACSSRIRPGIVLRRYLFCVLSSLCRPLFLCFGGHYSCGSTVAVAPCTRRRTCRGMVGGCPLPRSLPVSPPFLAAVAGVRLSCVPHPSAVTIAAANGGATCWLGFLRRGGLSFVKGPAVCAGGVGVGSRDGPSCFSAGQLEPSGSSCHPRVSWELRVFRRFGKLACVHRYAAPAYRDRAGALVSPGCCTLL